jgi:hypothetical protein
MRRIQYIWLFSAGLALASCGESAPKQPDASQQPNETVMRAAPEEELDSEVIFVLPSTVQVGQIFQEAGLPYVEGITLNTDAVGQFNTKASKLLAYGIYSTDLSYCVLNDQNELVLRQMKSLKSLADDLGLTEIFAGDQLFERFEKAIGDQDAILELMIEIQERTDSYIDDYDLGEEGVVIFAGAWVEGMYIGVKGADPSEQSAISGRLMEQMTILENLLVALKEVSVRSNQLSELYTDLQGLHNTYSNFEEVKNAENPVDAKVSLTNLHELAGQISTIRESLVESNKDA